MNKEFAITAVAQTRLSEDGGSLEDLPTYIESVREAVIGVGTSDEEAVIWGLASGAIKMPVSDERLSSADVVSILEHGAIVTFHRTEHGVLITDGV